MLSGGSPRTTTVGASGEVAAADPQRQFSARPHPQSGRPSPSPNAPPLDQAEKTITAQVADFGEPIVKQALGRLRTRLLGGEPISKPTRILQLICEDIRRERCQRSPNPYAPHGWSRFGSEAINGYKFNHLSKLQSRTMGARTTVRRLPAVCPTREARPQPTSPQARRLNRARRYRALVLQQLRMERRPQRSLPSTPRGSASAA